MRFETVNLSQACRAIEISIATRQNLCLIGAPGIGKTALVDLVTKAMGLPFRTLIGSAMAPEDIGGMPVRNDADKTIERWILGAYADLVKAGQGVMFLDEITDTPRAVWSALQRAINERWVGDTKLPEGIAHVMACNPPEISTGGQDLSLPVIGRITFVIVKPDVEEVAAYFAGHAPSYQATSQGKLAEIYDDLRADFAATLGVMPELIQADPPAGAQADQSAWGAPRAWERGLQLFAGALDAGEPETSHLARALLIGSVGPDSARGFLGVRKIRASLPTYSEIIADPLGAKIPNADTLPAILGVLAMAGKRDPWAPWIYADRLPPEGKIVAGRVLMRTPSTGKASPHTENGKRVRVKIEAEINRIKRAA